MNSSLRMKGGNDHVSPRRVCWQGFIRAIPTAPSSGENGLRLIFQ